jgi:hypothetical protein
MEIVNPQILRSSDAIIIDLTNSPNYKGYNSLMKFNSYKAVMEFGDSTKIFFLADKSFYGGSLNRKIVWSNPPYKYFNKE